VDDLARQHRLDRFPKQPLLVEAVHLVARGEREGKVRHHRVEERNPRLERPGHRRSVGLHEQVVDEIAPEIDVLEACHQLEPLRLGEPCAR
jgi:hypothetical protein